MIEAYGVEVSDDFLAFLTGEEPAPPAIPVPTQAIERRREANAAIERITDELLTESMGTLRGALRFADLDPQATEPPPEWVERWGAQEARKQFDLARMALMPAAQAPVGLKIAAQVATGILKSRNEKQVPQTLNVQFVQFQLPDVKYPSRKVER